MEYRSDYFDDPDATASFERATREIFRLDFTRWKDRGLWNAGYRPFSAFVEGVCVASLCVYPSQMRVGGRPKQGAQLLTVGTLPEYRSRGIQRELWARAHAWIRRECDFAFLFTDDEAAGLYTGLGLRRQPEFSESVSCPRSARWAEPRFKLLDLAKDADFATIERLAHARGMVSDRLGFFNPNLLLFMFLYFYQSWSYYLEDIDAVIVAEKTADRLRIHDIVATEMPRLSDIGSFLAHFKKEEVEFLFCTDRLDTGPVKKRPVKDSVLFVSDDFDLEGEYVFPSPFARNCRERALIAGAPASRRLLLHQSRRHPSFPGADGRFIFHRIAGGRVTHGRASIPGDPHPARRIPGPRAARAARGRASPRPPATGRPGCGNRASGIADSRRRPAGGPPGRSRRRRPDTIGSMNWRG